MAHTLKELCLEVSNYCTMECRHCSSRSVRVGTGHSVLMPYSTASTVIRDFAQMGGKVLEISGGEPLIYPDLPRLVRLASSLSLEVRLYTSGIMADERNRLSGIKPLDAQMYKSWGANKIIFNLEGADPKTHHKMMGVIGTHELVLEGIRNTKSAGLWTGVHFVPTKINYHELPDVAKLCLSMGVDELAILRFVPQGRGKDNQNDLELALPEFHSLLQSILELKNALPGLSIRAGCPMDFLSLYDTSIKPHPCKAGRTTAVISPEGNVLPCPGFKNSSAYQAGNINKDSLANIWEKGFEGLRNLNFRDISGPCASCNDLTLCLGRCAAQRLLYNGDIAIGPDPACPRRISLLKVVNYPT